MTQAKPGISSFQSHLSWWVLGCMVIGVVLGTAVPALPEALGKLQLAGISLPIAVLIWVMIYPMMIKVDFNSIRAIGENPRGLFVTWVVNWLIKPFTMYGFSCLFLYGLFRIWIAPDLANPIFSGNGASGSRSLYGHGLCLEHPDPRKSGLHRGAMVATMT